MRIIEKRPVNSPLSYENLPWNTKLLLKKQGIINLIVCHESSRQFQKLLKNQYVNIILTSCSRILLQTSLQAKLWFKTKLQKINLTLQCLKKCPSGSLAMARFGIFWLLRMKTSVRADSDTKEATIRRKARRNRQEKEKGIN